jgi:hypothetical protein
MFWSARDASQNPRRKTTEVERDQGRFWKGGLISVMHTSAASLPKIETLWRDFLLPKEHGSWSLAFEPLALALLVAPSTPGAFLALAIAAVFFARRPLRLAWRDREPKRRELATGVLSGCLVTLACAFAAAVTFGGIDWLMWLAPAAIAGAIFAWCDLRGEGREEFAEIAGAAAFALVPAAFAILADWSALSAAALSIVMLGRSVPSVMSVRAFLRAAKSGKRRDGPALVVAGLAFFAAVLLVRLGVAPWFAVVALAVLALRTLALLVVVRPAWRASTLGMMEAVLGLVFVVGLAACWGS